jgi:L-seryl-tRNA(Ser) seleniumtransferase
MVADRTNPLRGLPSVDEVLKERIPPEVIERHGRAQVLTAVRTAVAQLRAAIGSGPIPPGDAALLAAERALELLVDRDHPSPRPVLNLTGTVIHTNLGRAVMPPEAIEAMAEAARNASNLEFDLQSGQRADRDDHVEPLLRSLTGAEAATVVNNNAAALMLVLNTLAPRKEVPVSRGQLIEIGGSFRLPDIMARAGAKLREVGTTNKTRIEDYRDAIGPQTALLMEVHTSNYEIRGFTGSVPTPQLAALARASRLPFMVDLGSGSLVDLAQFGLQREPTVQEVISNGADLAVFSGDKLLGGPQAGIIVGRADLIARIKRNPMKRALRVDKITIAALAAVLKLYGDPDRLAVRLPVLRLLSRHVSDIAAQASRLLPSVRACLEGIATVEIADCDSQVGSGASPTATIPSAGLILRPLRRGDRALRLFAQTLRESPVPVIGRLQQGGVLLDLRCLDQDHALLEQLEHLAAGHTPSRQ